MANEQQQPQVIERVVIVERMTDHSLLWFLVFGWWYLGWVVFKWCWRVLTWPVRFAAKVGFTTFFVWPWRVCVAMTRWTVRGVRAGTPYAVAGVRVAAPWAVTATRAATQRIARQSQAFSERYGWRGWAVIGGAVVALGILGSIIH